MKFLSALILLLAFNSAWACSCREIAFIEEAIEERPVLVEALVVSLEQADTKYGRQTYSATLKVIRVMKGKVSLDVITVTHWMCYTSLELDMMEVGHTYVLPLDTPIDGQYGMAQCSHSGMELIGDQLYTFEPTNNTGGRERRFHAKYSKFVRGLVSR
jgi:hypothetical protein